MKFSKIDILTSVLTAFFIVACYSGTMAQQDETRSENDTTKNYSEIETTQDKIEDVTLKIYEYYEDYPDFTYTYNYDNDGNLQSVEIVGVGNEKDMKALEEDLTLLANLRKEIENQSNRMDVYYVTETLPKPQEGYEEFYDELYSEISYPERAVDNQIEGRVYVKFLVDEDGEIILTVADHGIEVPDYQDHLVDKMVDEAVTAVQSTSGEWTPGKIGGIPVTQWMMIPVEFNAKLNPTLRPLH